MTDPTRQDKAPLENEVVRAARLAKEQAAKADATTPDPATVRAKADHAGKTGWKTGVGIGVGSAALLAALLFANRKK